MVKHQNVSNPHLNKSGAQVLPNEFAEAIFNIINYIAWLVITNIILITMIMMKMNLSLRPVQLVKVF